MNILTAPVSDVDKIWPLIHDKMQAGCAKTGGATSSGEMWQMCRTGNAFLIVGHEEEIVFASVWRFETWSSGLVFRCVGLCGNKIPEWFMLLYDYAKAQAKLGGTDRLVAEGRIGLSRFAGRYLKVKRLSESFEVE